MRQLRLLVALAVVVAACGGAGAADNTETTSTATTTPPGVTSSTEDPGDDTTRCGTEVFEFPELIPQCRIHFQVPGMDAVRVEEDLVYQDVDGTPFTFDLYFPAEEASADPYPVVLLTHGEFGDEDLLAAVEQDWVNEGYFQSWGEVLAASGVAVAAFNRRTAIPDSMEQSLADIEAMIDLVQSDGSELGLDPNRICLMGSSAATPLMLQLGLTSSRVSCTVTLYGGADLSPDVGGFGGTPRPEHDAATFIDQADDPGAILVVIAGEDEPFYLQDTSGFLAEAREAGLPVSEITHETGIHGFDLFQGDERTTEIIDEVVQFIRSSLGA